MTAPFDFRKGIDGLKSMCKQKLFNDLFSGIVFAITNKSSWCMTRVAFGYAKKDLAGQNWLGGQLGVVPP